MEPAKPPPKTVDGRDLDERRLAMDEEFGRERLKIDQQRADRESKFGRSNVAVIISAMIAVVTIVVGLFQFWLNQGQEARKLEAALQATADDQAIKIQDQRMKVLEYLTAQMPLIFSDKETDDTARRHLRTVMIAGLKHETITQLFPVLRRTTPRGDQIWREGEQHYRWTPVGTGDCGGRDVEPYTASATPKIERCDAGFERRIAVCWDGGKFKNSSSGSLGQQWCTYKLVTPDTCIGGTNQGVMYQCVSTFTGD